MIKIRFLITSALLLMIIHASAQTQQERLEKAYKTRSQKALRSFIDRWALQPNDTVPIARMREPYRSIQEVYAAYYGNPRGVFEGDSFALLEPAFVVLSDKIDFAILDSIDLLAKQGEDRSNFLGYEHMQVIQNRAQTVRRTLQPFIPHLPGTDIRYLLLDSTYQRMIEDFLQKPTGKGKDRGHDPDKVNFLSRYLPMQKRHWGEYWNFMSYPEIEFIVLDRKFEQAIIWFNTSSASGVAYLVKEEGAWRQYTSRILISQ